MHLLETYDRLFQPLRSVFPQERTFQRAYRLSLGLLTSPAPHLTSTALCTLGRQFRDWTADYRLFSRSPWKPRQLFTPLFVTRHDLSHRFSQVNFRLISQVAPPGGVVHPSGLWTEVG